MTRVTRIDTLPNDIILIKQRLDALERAQFLQKPPLLAALPPKPVDGQEVRFQNAAMATEGVEWRFVYRSAAATFKWEFIGGSAFSIGPQGVITIAANEEKALTGGPSYTVPLTGVYEVEGSARTYSKVNGLVERIVRIAKNGVPGVVFYDYVARLQFDLVQSGLSTRFGATAGDVLTINVAQFQAVESSYDSGRLAVLPVAVS